jgi:CopG family transcriptional regulator, nickel-responsive regulator
MRHTFDKVINTHLHSKIDKDKCLEIFFLKGDASEINEMARQFQGNRNMDNVELVVT